MTENARMKSTRGNLKFSYRQQKCGDDNRFRYRHAITRIKVAWIFILFCRCKILFILRR